MSSAFDTALHNRRNFPNIFEMFAQESLHQSIEPACKHIVKVAYCYFLYILLSNNIFYTKHLLC